MSEGTKDCRSRGHPQGPGIPVAPRHRVVSAIPMSKGPMETQPCPHCHVAFAADWYTTSIHFGDVGPASGERWGYKATTCRACSEPIIEIGTLDTKRNVDTLSSRTTAWPRNASRVPLPKEVPDTFSADYREACAVIDASPKAAAALSRRCLQHLLRDHVKVAHADLSTEIEHVLNSKALPSDLARDIDAIRHVGNFAAHPMKSTHSGEILDVEPEEAEWILNVLEELFDFYFVRTSKRAAQRDALNAKIAKAKKNVAIKKPPQ